MRTLTITEAREHRLDLTDAEATALRDAGRRMIGKLSWWGHNSPANDQERAVIRTTRLANGSWSVRTGNVVGVVVVGDLQILVQPKIPIEHLLYLLQVGGHLPRFDSSLSGGVESGKSLFDLIARWFVGCLEQVLRADLMRDYRPADEFLPVLRGKLRPGDTARAFYRGRLGLQCDYEHYDVDSPMNRLLKAGARVVLSNPTLDSALQKRAARAVARMSEIGEFAASDDSQVVIDRRTKHCTDAVALARQIVRGSGLTLRAGSSTAWTFLIETSSPVERGLRELIANHQPGRNVRKQGIQLSGTTMKLNPDLVFGAPDVVADVKYKISGREWNRNDLYQLVAFAAGYRVQRAALLAFSPHPEDVPPPARFGDIEASATVWDTTCADPVEAGDDFVRRFATWLQQR